MTEIQTILLVYSPPAVAVLLIGIISSLFKKTKQPDFGYAILIATISGIISAVASLHLINLYMCNNKNCGSILPVFWFVAFLLGWLVSAIIQGSFYAKTKEGRTEKSNLISPDRGNHWH